MNKKKKKEFINGLDKLGEELESKISAIDNHINIMTPEGINNNLNKLSIVELEYYANKLIRNADTNTLAKVFDDLQKEFNIDDDEFNKICPNKDSNDLLEFTNAWFKNRDRESIKLLILKFKTKYNYTLY